MELQSPAGTVVTVAEGDLSDRLQRLGWVLTEELPKKRPGRPRKTSDS